MVGCVYEVEVGRGRVGYPLRDTRDRPVLGCSGGGDHQVPELHLRVIAAAGTDPKQVPGAELYQLLSDDGGRGTTHRRGLDGDRVPLVGAGVTEHPALLRHEPRVLEEVLRDVPGTS